MVFSFKLNLTDSCVTIELLHNFARLSNQECGRISKAQSPKLTRRYVGSVQKVNRERGTKTGSVLSRDYQLEGTSIGLLPANYMFIRFDALQAL